MSYKKLTWFLGLNSTYIDFATPVEETQLTTTQSVSLVNCLGSDTCFAVKFDSSKYYSYTSSNFSSNSSGQTICNKTACEIISCNFIYLFIFKEYVMPHRYLYEKILIEEENLQNT